MIDFAVDEKKLVRVEGRIHQGIAEMRDYLDGLGDVEHDDLLILIASRCDPESDHPDRNVARLAMLGWNLVLRWRIQARMAERTGGNG